MSYGLGGQFWKGENEEVVFNDLSRAYFRRLWRKHGYALVLPMPFERFAKVLDVVARREMEQALQGLEGTRLGQDVRCALGNEQDGSSAGACRTSRP